MPFMIGAAVVGLGSAYMQSRAADKAGERSANAANAATAEQRREYDLARQDQMPWLKTGQSALYQLGGLMGLNGGRPDYSAFTNSPGYKFAQQQGLQGLDRSAAARGGLYSGGHQADVLNYAEGLASQQFNNYANRLAGLAGVGQTTAANLGNQGMNMATNVGNIGLGNAQQQNQSSYDRTNAWTNFGNQLVGGFGQWYGNQNQTRPQPYNTNKLLNQADQTYRNSIFGGA